jgi:hypothetical protein
MTIASTFEKAIAMGDRVWKRHSNPWSVYTGFLTTPSAVLR